MTIWVAMGLGVVLLLAILLDMFEVMLLPRRVYRAVRFPLVPNGRQDRAG